MGTATLRAFFDEALGGTRSATVRGRREPKYRVRVRDDVHIEFIEAKRIDERREEVTFVYFVDSRTDQPKASSVASVDDFLESAYLLSTNGHTSEAIEWVIDYIDDALNDGEFK